MLGNTKYSTFLILDPCTHTGVWSMSVDENVSRKNRKKKTLTQKKEANNRARNKANDPLQNFDGDVNMDGLLDDGDEAAEEGGLDEDKSFKDRH